MKIKATVMYYFTWISLAIIKNALNNDGEGVKKRSHFQLLVGV